MNKSGNVGIVAAESEIDFFYNNSYIKSITSSENIISFDTYKTSDSENIDFIYSDISNIYIYNVEFDISLSDPFISFSLKNTLSFSSNKICINSDFVVIQSQLSNQVNIYTYQFDLLQSIEGSLIDFSNLNLLTVANLDTILVYYYNTSILWENILI